MSLFRITRILQSPAPKSFLLYSNAVLHRGCASSASNFQRICRYQNVCWLDRRYYGSTNLPSDQTEKKSELEDVESNSNKISLQNQKSDSQQHGLKLEGDDSSHLQQLAEKCGQLKEELTQRQKELREFDFSKGKLSKEIQSELEKEVEEEREKPNKFRWGLAFLAVVLANLGYAIYWYRLEENKSVTAEDIMGNQKEKIEELKNVIRSIPRYLRSSVISPVQFEFYRYPTCPFCSIVESYLKAYDIKAKYIDVDPINKKEIKKGSDISCSMGYAIKNLGSVSTVLNFACCIESRNPDYKSDGNTNSDNNTITNTVVLVDSKEICDIISTPLNQTHSADEEKWRYWSRDVLVRYIVVNMNLTFSDAINSFEYVDKMQGSSFHKLCIKLLGAPVMFIVSKTSTKSKLKQLNQEVIPGKERNQLFDLLRVWMNEGLKGNKFNGGDSPSMGDLDVYGIVNSLQQHKMLNEIYENVNGLQEWMNRVKNWKDK